MLALLLFGSFLLLATLGMPVGHALLVATLATLIIGFDIPLALIPNALITGVDQWIWLTMPLFLMMGNLMNVTGITDRLIDLSQEIVGFIAGGLSHVAVGTNVLMAGMSGSACADCAATGAIIIPAMKKEGYPAGYASMIISTSSIIGPLIPPSLGLIIVGVICRLSVLRLWLAGAVPGFILGLSLIITGYIMAKKKGFPRREGRPSLKPIAATGLRAAPALMIPFGIIGGMRLGVFTPTEAGGAGVAYALLLGFLVFRKLNLQGFRGSALETAKLTAPLMWIVAAALLFGVVVGRIQVGPPFVHFLLGISQSPIVFLLVVSLLVLALGCIMEATPIIVILLPILFPAAEVYGIDPIHFGLLFFYVLLVSQSTPPLGPAMFMTNAIAGCSVKEYMVEGWPLLITHFSLIPLFVFFPALITWFPDLIMGPRLG